MKIILLLVVNAMAFTTLVGQYDHESVFKNLEGEALKNALIEKYKPRQVLTYGQARDYMYSEVDVVDNKLTCVYSGFTITMNPNSDPSSDALNKGINTEHTFPRSKGAFEGSFGFSDMHHLFPTRAEVNTARWNYNFKEIKDSNTDEWYRNNQLLRTKPTSNIDEYSELDNYGYFEPREDHKGDVARAYFYFYTMYKANADLKDDNFFAQQQETMCDWHFKDPVSEKEWKRNIAIAKGQGNKNPFVLDCSLARIYCKDLLGTCQTVNVKDTYGDNIIITNNEGILLIKGHPSNSILKVYNTIGQEVAHAQLTDSEMVISIEKLPIGLYVLTITHKDIEVSTLKIVK